MSNFYRWLIDDLKDSQGAGTFIMAFLTMIIIPVYHWFLPPFLILWCLLYIFELRKRGLETFKINNQEKILFLISIIFFIWQIIGLLYTTNIKGGLRNIELRISLLIFPLLLISPGNAIRKKCLILLRVFSVSTFAFLLICYVYALYRSIEIHNGVLTFNPHLPAHTWLNYFYGLEFAIFQHTSYLSMFVLFSVFIFLEGFFDTSISKILRYFSLFSSIVLIVSIYLLSSRALLLASIVILPLYLFQKLKKLDQSKYLGFGVVILVLIFVIISLTNPRVNNFSKWRSGKDLGDIAIKDQRLIIWQSISSIIKNNLVFGVGTGDIQDEMNKEYIRFGNKMLADANTNAHNQFLEIIIENGLIGISIFVSMFGMMFFIAVKEKNILYLTFILIVFFSFMFETMLNRLAGVSFFSLFSFLLIHLKSNVPGVKAEK